MRLKIALFWAVFIAVVHAISSDDLSLIYLDDLFTLDKLFHFLVFAIGAWLLIPIVLRQCTKHAYLFIFAGYAFYGIILELMQGAFIEGRSASFLDWLADILGVLIAILLHKKIYRIETIKS